MNGCRVPFRLYRTVNTAHASRRRAAAGITRGPPLTSSRTSETSGEAAPYRPARITGVRLDKSLRVWVERFNVYPLPQALPGRLVRFRFRVDADEPHPTTRSMLQTTPASRSTGPAYMYRRDQELSETTGPSCRAFHTLKDLM